MQTLGKLRFPKLYRMDLSFQLLRNIARIDLSWLAHLREWPLRLRVTDNMGLHVGQPHREMLLHVMLQGPPCVQCVSAVQRQLLRV